MCGIAFTLLTVSLSAPNHIFPCREATLKFTESRAQRFTSKISCQLNNEIEPTSYLSALSLPMHPNPNLSPEDVVYTVCKGLQFNDVPTLNTGTFDVFISCKPINILLFRTRALLPLRGFFMPIGYNRKTRRSISGKFHCVSYG